MHLGRTYPFLFERWQAECFFWPGFVPRKLHVSCAAGFGTSWDRLERGVVTDVGVPDAFLIGDPQWMYLDPAGFWELEVLFHKVVEFPAAYSLSVWVREFPSGVVSLCSGQVDGPQYSFAGWTFTAVSTFLPYSTGAIPPIQIRAATWSEV